MAIISSLLDADFYKFTMGQLIWRLYPDIHATFALKNRTAKVHLGKIIDLGELREELDHVRNLRFTHDELAYLRGISQHGEQMFCEPYLEFLRGFKLPDFNLEKDEDTIRLEFSGPWLEVSHWETIALSIVNQLYYRTIMKDFSQTERDAVAATGHARLTEKIAILREHPSILFSDFGTRRRFSVDEQYRVVETFHEQLPDQFLGTSNVYAAMRYHVAPIGTMAHELFMVMAGVMDGEEDWLSKSQQRILKDWWDEYGFELSIFLPDTYGSDFFFNLLSPEQLAAWKGFRWDSGDVFAFGEKVIARYEKQGIDARQKLLVPSDGLDLPVILKIHDRFSGRMKLSYGWGTGLTNDLLPNAWRDGYWYGPLSLVVKAVEANHHGLVKLSDNLEKATGKPEDITRYKSAAGYASTFREECKY